MRWLWFCLGWLMVTLGVVGVLLPVMPTTIFLIMAVCCFSRSSPRFESWLLSHPRYGRPLRQWKEHGAISAKGKCFAACGMVVGYILFFMSAHPGWRLAVGVGLFFVISAAYVLSRPLPQEVPAEAVSINSSYH
ncbi:MAG: YbaN family protein [Stenotrophomonas sp.]